jgi:hypothetical protein
MNKTLDILFGSALYLSDDFHLNPMQARGKKIDAINNIKEDTALEAKHRKRKVTIEK